MLAILSVPLIILALVYLFIPDNLTVSESVYVGNSIKSIKRGLAKETWHKWWPTADTGDVFLYQQKQYTLLHDLYTGVAVQIRNDQQALNSIITVLPAEAADSNIVKWEYTVPTGSSPIQKIKTWLAVKNSGRQLGEILQNLKAFVSSDDKIYGLKIDLQRVTDTVLVATRFTTPYYPGPEDIYQHTGLLKKYIAQQAAAETNAPMLHVNKNSDGKYEAMVAIPTSRILPSTAAIMHKRMIDGNILVAEVKGGQATVDHALQVMELFVADKELSAPAIPFASLITDRLQQPDTSKWVTKVYYPIY